MKNQSSFCSFFNQKKLNYESGSSHTTSSKAFLLTCFLLFIFSMSLFSVKEVSATHFCDGNISAQCDNPVQNFVQDVQATVPTISCPANITDVADAGMCSKANVTYAATATGIPAPTITYSIAPGATFNVGTYTITATADNGVGTDICTFTVTISDAEAPTITCGAPLVISNMPSYCGGYTILSEPIATDNCPGMMTFISDESFFYPIGTTTVTWIVTDANNNSSTCTQTVTVEDTEAPTITCGAPLVISNMPSYCGGYTILTEPIAIDNCAGMLTFTSDESFFYPIGTTTVTWIVTDANNNASTCTQTVTVEDTEPPVATCQNYTLNLLGGAGTVLPANIDNGSNDNCGILGMSVWPNTFTGANAGPNTVTLTVIDIHGNSSTCQAVVTVTGQNAPTCSIKVTPANNVYTGGVPTTLYLGYGPQSATIAAAVVGAGYTYSWSPATYLSNANISNPVFTASAQGTTTYTVTIADNNGGTATCTVTMCVIDARSFHKGVPNGKVNLCHVPPGNAGNHQNLSISVNAAASHLTGHTNDKLGTCGQVCGGLAKTDNTEDLPELLENEGFETIVYPNPNNGEFTIEVHSHTDGQVNAVMYDMLGNKVADLNGIKVNTPYKVSKELANGVYFLHVEQAGHRQIVKLIKQ